MPSQHFLEYLPSLHRHPRLERLGLDLEGVASRGGFGTMSTDGLGIFGFMKILID